MEAATGSPQTPPTNSILLPPDTARISRHTSQASYRTGDLELGRKAVLADLERYLTAPMEGLLSCMDLPPALEVREVCNTVASKMDDVLVTSESGRRHWAGFPSPPSKSKANEETTFRPFDGIFSAVFKNVEGCGLFFEMNPSNTPLSERRNTSRPDGYILRSRSRVEPLRAHWFDIAVPFEFKKDCLSGARRDNEQKIIWSLHNIMREDPCRRFAFGVTVEDDQLRLWLSNRALLTVSQPINFLEEVERMICLLTSLALASVGLGMEGLGWDPTVERFNVGEIFQYKFTVGKEIFTTRKPLSAYGADSMVGRGTRVYEAVDSQGNTVAVKDSWRDFDRQQEGEILNAILESCRNMLTQEEADEAEGSFVRIKLYDDVNVSGKPDVTGNPMEHAEGDPFQPEWVTIDLEPIRSGSSHLHLSSAGGVPDSGRAVTLPTQRLGHVRRKETGIPRRVHTRTVFSDVGVPLQDITGLSEYLGCLRDALKGLRLLHKAGWMHRDFSVGNVMRIGGRGKLGDFEYAKQANSNVTHELRTGTLQFMPVEVEADLYLFLPHNEEEPPPFRMNFVHDVESAWWTFAWALFYYADEKSNDKDELKEQLKMFNKAFQCYVGNYARRDLVCQVHGVERACMALSTTCRRFSDGLVKFATALRRAYVRAESSNPTINVTEIILQNLYTDVLAILTQSSDNATDVKLRPAKETLDRVGKRPRDGDELQMGSVERKRALYA